MVDRIVLVVGVNSSDYNAIRERVKMIECREGNEVFYRNTLAGRFEALELQLRGGKLTIKGSLHKFYNKEKNGRLENIGMFSFGDARTAFGMLFARLGITGKGAILTYFEIGANLIVPEPPIEYIKAMQSIKGVGGKLMFNDANYRQDRQRTTEKSKTIKKHFKVYDKNHEMEERGKSLPLGYNILRIESVYKRQRRKLEQFLSEENARKLVGGFFKDWESVYFAPVLKAKKGVRESEKAKALEIIQLGTDSYIAKMKEEYNLGIITKKVLRGAQEFAKKWETNRKKFQLTETEQEKGYFEALREFHKLLIMRVMPIWALGNKNVNS